MSQDDIEAIMRRLECRQVHVRQYLGRGVFELWADGRFVSWWVRPLDVELAIRRLLEITDAQGAVIGAEIQRRAGVS